MRYIPGKSVRISHLTVAHRVLMGADQIFVVVPGHAFENHLLRCCGMRSKQARIVFLLLIPVLTIAVEPLIPCIKFLHICFTSSILLNQPCGAVQLLLKADFWQDDGWRIYIQASISQWLKVCPQGINYLRIPDIHCASALIFNPRDRRWGVFSEDRRCGFFSVRRIHLVSLHTRLVAVVATGVGYVAKDPRHSWGWEDLKWSILFTRWDLGQLVLSSNPGLY